MLDSISIGSIAASGGSSITASSILAAREWLDATCTAATEPLLEAAEGSDAVDSPGVNCIGGRVGTGESRQT